MNGNGESHLYFEICNYSSVGFYLLQTLYSIFLLVKLCRRTERKPKRSKTLIAAIMMTIYCSIALCILFGFPEISVKASRHNTSLRLRFFLIFFRDLPFSLVTISHLLILNSYFELTFILDILCDLQTLWQEASNKLSSRRQCLNALNIIIIAFVIAHFLDKAYYTMKQGGDEVRANGL